jgi:antitoxin component of MazEF toxin-antitoxin module
MSRTLITVGKSTAVTIPPDVLERYGLKAGDTVNLVMTEQGITIVPNKGLDPAFENALRVVSRERNALFQRLADHDRDGQSE